MSDQAVHEILTWLNDHGWRLFFAGWCSLWVNGAAREWIKVYRSRSRF